MVTKKKKKTQKQPFKDFSLEYNDLLLKVNESLVVLSSMSVDGIVEINYDDGRKFEFKRIC